MIMPMLTLSSPTTLALLGVFHPLAHYVSYDKFSPNHRVLLATITSHNEPRHFSQAA